MIAVYIHIMHVLIKSVKRHRKGSAWEADDDLIGLVSVRWCLQSLYCYWLSSA